ncbi:hypothetical protein HZC31_04760 [Candidatus Woesearchaeota archaeon]|nr:hypothetical protein [Candidatus Woesearchaeota archaeon]
MNFILQNFLLQMSSLLLGVLGGSFLSVLAQEEISLYKKKIDVLTSLFSFTILLAPALFFLYFSDFKKILPFFVLFLVYVFLFWRTKDKKEDIFRGFLYISPLTLFLASADKDVFFLTLSLFLVVVVLWVVSLFPSLEKMSFWRKCIFLAQEFSGFIFMTALVYLITAFSLFF